MSQLAARGLVAADRAVTEPSAARAANIHCLTIAPEAGAARRLASRAPGATGGAWTGARLLLVCCAAALALRVTPARAESPEPGTVLSPETAGQIDGLLPPEFAGRYARGEWRHEVALPKPGTHLIDPDWLAAGKENEGQFTVNEHGSIREIATGEQPARIWGPPFPTIDPSDPNAGVKIAWNFFYQSYILGDDRNLVALTWVSPSGDIDRQLTTEVFQKFWDGQKPFRLPAENPMNLLFQQLVQVKFPADVEGTTALSWRYRDERRDQNWAYVPALRRVRSVSPNNRSDGFMGSDMSPDDGSYFDGKPEDFVWKLVRGGEELFLLDRASVVDGREDLRALPGGGWRGVYEDKPRFQFQSPQWQEGKTGVPWAPVPDRFVLVRRPVWFVEVTPRDKYYLYGKIVLAFDKETWFGSYSSKYDWQGNLLNSYLPLRGAYFKKGDDYRSYSAGQFTMSQNWKMDRATVSFSEANDGTVPSDSLIPIASEVFEVNSLARAGR